MLASTLPEEPKDMTAQLSAGGSSFSVFCFLRYEDLPVLSYTTQTLDPRPLFYMYSPNVGIHSIHTYTYMDIDVDRNGERERERDTSLSLYLSTYIYVYTRSCLGLGGGQAGV